MSAAVARRGSPRVGRPDSRTSSPIDSKKAILKSEENSKKGSPLQAHAVPPSDTATTENKDDKDATNTETSQPLAPPPRPAQQSASDTPDYFSSVHNSAHFSLEPNPFEQSFGDPATETPGKSILPPVAALTSPALPGTSSAGGFNWSNSLRAGPLSPAMLAGPAGSNDYFDSIARGFPTPNESSLRTGLTPGGGGSMFPAPSPNSQVLLQQLQNSGATPSTLDFHRTAINAAKSGFQPPTSNTTQEQEQQQVPATTMDSKVATQNPVDTYSHHHEEAADAANGLFMLAKGGQTNGQFVGNGNQTVPSQAMQTSPTTQAPQSQAQQPSQEMATNTKRGSRKANAADTSPEVNEEMSESPKPNARGRGKKNGTKATQPTNGRRKADDAPTKGSNKKAKANNSSANVDPTLEHAESEEPDPNDEQTGADGKKMTEEEKRKNFLERNRIAALKCRQRKKQWQANLQNKVEIYSSENDALQATIAQLREEVVNLKTLLMAHKNCNIPQSQQAMNTMPVMNGMPAEYNPYNMAMPPNGIQQGVPRR
ncbi:hypothetical protein FQN54_007192 [Arachnomyces sp. PD_36]|nr:hypothetical protein FQN54_007192 [Arachnomyces sp. PD_36]